VRQFLDGGDAAFAVLEQRATGSCVVFAQQVMPPGAHPATARVGFEVRQNGSATLFVERGVRFTRSADERVRRWFSGGQLDFGTFQELRQWIQTDLKGCYVSALDAPVPPRDQGEHGRIIAARELTDLEAVANQLPANAQAAHVDEDDLFQQLVTRIRGQDDAMRGLAKHVSRHLARQAPRRPATLMALGPTGVGKTAAAEYLPTALRDQLPDGAAYGYLRLDMSEYQERHRISQLLGAPQGYVGYGDGAQLVDRLRANARTVVLLDEIEKAHPDILRALMNCMDCGRLSTASAHAGGREVDCRRAVFLFTANLDAMGILQELETRKAFGNRAAVDAVCRRRLLAAGVAPELVGRIGCFLVFRPLDQHARAEVVALAIERVAGEYGVRVVRIAPAVVADILRTCPPEGFGARPDEYLVDELLGPCLAEAAATGLKEPMEVAAGPPYHCLRAEEPAQQGEVERHP